MENTNNPEKCCGNNCGEQITVNLTATLLPAQLETKIHEFIGAASMCWENVSGAGQYQPETALEIAKDLIAEINNHMQPRAIYTDGDKIIVTAPSDAERYRSGIYSHRKCRFTYCPNPELCKADNSGCILDGDKQD